MAGDPNWTGHIGPVAQVNTIDRESAEIAPVIRGPPCATCKARRSAGISISVTATHAHPRLRRAIVLLARAGIGLIQTPLDASEIHHGTR